MCKRSVNPSYLSDTHIFLLRRRCLSPRKTPRLCHCKENCARRGVYPGRHPSGDICQWHEQAFRFYFYSLKLLQVKE